MNKKIDLVEVLEFQIDRTSLLDVLTALEMACDEKAEFIDQQSNVSAKVWDKAAKAIYQAAKKIEPLGI